MRHSFRLKVVAIAAALALVASCGGSGDTEDSAGGGTLRVATLADVSSMDPVRGNAGHDHQMLYPLYDTLVSFNEALEAEPGLAESWEYESETVLVLKLREGVLFHDGETLDAEAVKYNLERAKSEDSTISPDVASIDSVEVVDDLTVRINLKYPDASLVMVLADRAGMMVSPAAAEAADGDLSTSPVGTGGWSFVEWRRGTSMTYEKFEDYWDADVDRVDRIVMTVISEPKTRAASLRSGQQDIAWDIAPADAEGVESADGTSIHEQIRMWLDHVYINTASDELNDPRVRRALSLAMDRELIASSGYFGKAAPSSGFLPQDYWATPPDEVAYPHDPEEARRLIAEAGAEGLTFDMIVYPDAGYTRVGEILKEQWADIGVTVNLLPREIVQAGNDFFNERQTPAMLSAWTGRPDPAMTYRLLFTAEAYFNTSDETTPGIDEALAEDARGTSQEERKPSLDQAAIAVYEHGAVLPIAFPLMLTGLQDHVNGYQGNLLGKAKLLGITLDN